MANSASAFDYNQTTVPPGALFVAADEPLLVFPSVAAAEQYLEAIDVKDGVYPTAFGPKGEPFRMASEGSRITIEPTGEANRADELRLLLLRYLEATDHTPDATAKFSDLVAMVWAFEADFWQEHDPYGERFGTRVPPWGCIAFLALLAVGLYFVL